MIRAIRWTCELAALIVLTWCVMTMTHELGHLVGGWCSGAKLVRTDLRPWHLPYSLHQPDPYPLVTLWGGPVLGVVIPMGIALICRRRWVHFIADFCLLANGVYLAIGWLHGGNMLDSARILDAGFPPFLLAVFCIVSIAMGYIRLREPVKEFFLPHTKAADPSGP